MGANYSSRNAPPRCQHCGASLPLNDARCANCGYYNGAQPAHNGYSPQPSWHTPDAQWQPSSPMAPGSQSQAGGSSKNNVAPPEQRNRYAPSPASSQVSQNGSPVLPGTIPPLWSAQPPRASFVGPENAYARPSGQLPPTASTRSGVRAGNPVPASAQQPSFYEEVKPRQRKHAGRIIGICALLVALIGASFLGYTFLFAPKSASTATSLPQTAPTNPVPTGNPLFQDNFTSNNSGWNIQSYPGEFAVSLGNGSLKLENDSNKLLWEVLPGDKTFNDFQLSVDATLSKGSQDNGYGVYIRGVLSQNMAITSFYRFELYGDGSFAIFKGSTDASGATTTPRLADYTNSSAILKQGGVNHLTIKAVGSTMRFIVNNQTLSTVTDTTYSSGAIALFVSNLQNAHPGAEATFAHLALYPAQK